MDAGFRCRGERVRQRRVWDDKKLRERSAQVAQSVEQLPQRFPTMLAMGELLGAGDAERRFDQALDVILAGLASFAGR